MADYNYNRGGRFGVRAPAPSTTYVNVADRTINQGHTVGRAQIYEEQIAMPAIVEADSVTRPRMVVLAPQHKTDGVVTEVETIVEQVYAPPATGFTSGFVSNSVLSNQTSTINEFISNAQTEVRGANRSAFRRGGLFHPPTLNDSSNTNSRTNDSGTKTWNKPTGGSTSNGTNAWSRPVIGGITNSSGASMWNNKPTGGTTKGPGISEPNRQTGGSAETIGTTGWSNPTRGGAGTNKSVTVTSPISEIRDAGANGWSKPVAGGNNEIGTNPSSGSGSVIIKDAATSNRLANPSGGIDIGTNSWGRRNDGTTDDIGPKGRRAPTGGTTNSTATNENRPTDTINNGGTSPQSRPSAVANNNDARARSKPIVGTNNTGHDGRSWSSDVGAGGTDTDANSRSRSIDETIKDVGPNGRRAPIGGTTNSTAINENRPTEPINSDRTGPQSRPTEGANNNDAGAWSKPIVGTNYTGQDGRNRPSGAGDTDTGTNSLSRPIDRTANDVGPNERGVPIGGTINSTATNEIRPTDPINSDRTGPQSRPSVGANNNGASAWSNPIDGTNTTANNGRSWSSGAGGIDTVTNSWGRPTDGTTNATGPYGTRVPIGGNDTGANSWGRPTDGTASWARPSSGSSGWSKPIDPTIFNPASHVTTTTMNPGEFRSNHMGGLAQPPAYDNFSSRPIGYMGSVVDTAIRATPQVPMGMRGQFIPSVIPAKGPERRTIDSNEAVRKYNGIAIPAFSNPARVIDSNEALRRYNGISIPAFPKPRR